MHRTTSGLLFGLPIVMDTQRDDIAVGQKLLLTYRGQELEVGWVRMRIMFAAHLAGLLAIDSPTPHYKDLEETAIQARWYDALSKALTSNDVKEKLQGMAFDALLESPTKTADYLRGEIVRWGQVVKQIGYKPE